MRMNKFDENARASDDALSGTGENASGQIIPLESVISEKDSRNMHREAELSEQIIAERTARANAPVHLEGLKPLPQELRNSAVGPGIIPGGPDALGMAPRMAHTIPPPYKRDRIAIDHHGKSWAYARAETVQPDDIVVDFGKVVKVYERVIHQDISEIGDGDLKIAPGLITGDRVAVGTEWVLVNVAGDSAIFDDPAEQVRVFRVHEDG